MKALPRIAMTFVISAASLAAAQTQRSTYDPAAKYPQKHRDGFADFALKQINPDNQNYGQGIEDVRRVVIAKTIDNLFFWSNSCALAFLAGAFVIVAHQTKERRHRHLIAARFLSWYHNELLEARTRMFEEVGKFERLRKAVDERQVTAAAAEVQGVAAAQTPRSPHENELMTENNSLRQKIALMEGSEKTLRQQNAQLSRLLREEQQKNRTSKTESGGVTVARKEASNGRA